MFRILVTSTLVIIFITLLFSHDLFAIKQTTRITKLPKKKEVKIKISWKERNNQILHDSVCFNYPEGDIVYRDCRQKAREVFRERCDKYEDLYKKTRYPYNKDHKRNMDMYCRSASTYWP